MGGTEAAGSTARETPSWAVRSRMTGVSYVSSEPGAARQRSSLVLGKNDSRDADASDSGRYDCRNVYSNFEYEADDGETAEYRCNQWACYCCGYRMRQNLVEEISRVTSERPQLRRMMTLTLDPAKAPDDGDEQHAYLTRRWNALRTELNDAFGSLSYIWVREEGEKSEDLHPHLHIIVDRYIPQSWLSTVWARLGGGEVVDIRYLDRVDQAARYIGKYLTKNALSGLPDGAQRYGSSSDISLDVRGNSGESDDTRTWSLVMDDYAIHPDDTLRRGVVAADYVQQRENGGPIGLDPPD